MRKPERRRAPRPPAGTSPRTPLSDGCRCAAQRRRSPARRASAVEFEVRMTLQELLSAGQLSEAIAAQSAALRARPADLDARWRLAVLLCFAGELDRASLQLDALTAQNAEFGMGCAVYRTLLL